ncbi:Transmembrane protein 132C Precursor [Larimichthys crocea]|uniref:Transmembrane protein 132C n=1 Tax=Larimichthys crocea TaxID=215358 RepID=A0A6G0IMI8_LARCR|nr:Transmembrane protein 132C Precursor [Larimichthys crocea]
MAISFQMMVAKTCQLILLTSPRKWTSPVAAIWTTTSFRLLVGSQTWRSACTPLLGVFCLAILVFLINCISYTLKYRHKELSIEGQENMNHAHDWVWLGNEAELLESQISLSPQQEEQTSMMDSSSGLEEGSHLLNGGSAQKNVQGQVHRAADTGCIAKDSKGDSPTTKRKRVKFTTFTTIPSDSSYPTVNTLTGSHSQDIKWVCQDVELGDSKELRNYMERGKRVWTETGPPGGERGGLQNHPKLPKGH